MKAHNDNDELSFITIGLAVRNVMTYLEPREKQQSDCERQAPEQDREKDNDDQRREAIEAGLRQIERFEIRYRRADRS